MTIVCVIYIFFLADGQEILGRARVRGKILQSNANTYTIDFSKSISTIYELADSPNNYKEIIVDKNRCWR